jgi:hypothetical protein
MMPRERGKGNETGRILCPLDDLADMLQEKLDHDNNLLSIQDNFLAIPSASEAHRSSSLPGFVNHLDLPLF